MSRRSSVSLSVVAALCTLAQANPTFTGSLSTADHGLVGVGGWVADDGSPVTFGWTVIQNDSLSWHYQYVFNRVGSQGGLSHLILETSQNLVYGDILNAAPSVQNGNPTWYTPGPSNKNMPGPIYGIKFEPFPDASISSISFDSSRAPMSGDFYAKDGNKGGMLWNAGFGTYTGSHILVPDTHTSIIPAPGALLLGSIGAGLIAWRRRRKTL